MSKNSLNRVWLVIAISFCMAACDNNEPVPAKEETPLVSSDIEDVNSDARTATVNDSDLRLLPKDNGGSHKPFLLGSTAAKVGYYLYTPGGYTSTNLKYPLLIFLHGKGERGDGSKSLTVLNKVLRNGPPKLIQEGKWAPKFPMLVVSPQFHLKVGNTNNWGGGDPAHLKAFIQFMISKYKVDPSRIYLTGLSHGGNGVFDYITKVDDASSLIAAAAPIACYGARSGFNRANETPVWTFVGESDATNFRTSKNFVINYNNQSPKPLHKAKISSFPKAGHDVWTRTYNNTGVGTASPVYDPFNMKLYDWMFKFKRTN